MIEITNLCYKINDSEILHDITLNLSSGGITALIGPNGAGKSSLLHCIAGLNSISSGQVMIDGIDPFHASSIDRARAVALLNQSPYVATRLKVSELVAFGRWPHHNGRATARDRLLVDDAIKAFELTELADRPLETLSGGQRQRAFIAMTYAQDTPWVLLDEPLNALDPKHAHDLMLRLQRLVQDTNRSIVIVMHDINSAARWADYIVAMKDGHIHAHDKSSTLLKPDTLHEIFGIHFDVLEHKGRPVVINNSEI